jgi:hypothetical protein
MHLDEVLNHEFSFLYRILEEGRMARQPITGQFTRDQVYVMEMMPWPCRRANRHRPWLSVVVLTHLYQD